MMLRNVLDDYLDKVKERELDLPLLLLLPALGFYDVHFVHGAVEFGKDFIAKRIDQNGVVQYSFQSKAGDINQSAWRNNIQGQILEAVLSSLSHPSFDTSIPHQVVFISTGELAGNAKLGFQNLNSKIENTYNLLPIMFWGKQNLVDHFLEHGLSSMLRATATGFEETGRYFLLYGRAMQGIISNREIELYSRNWVAQTMTGHHRLLRYALEAEILSKQCLAHGRVYEAVCAQLALLRVLCTTSYGENTYLHNEAFVQTMDAVRNLGAEYLANFRDQWGAERDLLAVVSLGMTTYLVQCARVMELASLAYFSSSDEVARSEIAAFLDDFIHSEPGCGHPLSDQYVVSLVMAALVLIDARRQRTVQDLLRRATVWVCDRYECGMGLAGLEADEALETRTLLGCNFDFILLPRPAGSFLAMALCDLTAFAGDQALYADIVNDIKACEIHMEYWQPQDSVGACSVEGDDVLHYPSVYVSDELVEPSEYQYAEHVQHECATFRFVDAFGPAAAVALMALLRDRYFPKLWPLLTRRSTLDESAHGQLE
jgi:hypothetical protein